MNIYDVVVIGSGPAGLAAAISAYDDGARVIIIERENRMGGILKQCIHDGFGVIRYGEKLSGPEYAERYIDEVLKRNIYIYKSTFVTKLENIQNIFKISVVNSDFGVKDIYSKTIIMATGCRERTARQVFIHGTRPAGIYTAGTAQYFVNILGYLPCKRCVILGSGDIGLIMARRLTLEGAEVVGVYEAKDSPSGLQRNISQCLEDFKIPLYLSHTVTNVFGEDRLKGVEISKVDNKMNPIQETQEFVECDGLILSVGLIPENELAESIGIKIDIKTKGPYVDQNFMTLTDGIFSCGNALHVNDLVDFVSESGDIAGKKAAEYSKGPWKRKLIRIEATGDFLYTVPQYIDLNPKYNQNILFFRTTAVRKNARVQVKAGDNILFEKKYITLRPPEMQRISIELPDECFNDNKELNILLGEDKIG